MSDTARWKATVYVGGLGPQVTVASLHDAFLPFGDIADVTLPKNERRAIEQEANEQKDGTYAPMATTGHRGFAYVEYEDADDAKEAIDNMNKSDFFGRTIKVTAAKAPKSAGEGLGSRTALWKQEAWLAENTISEEDKVYVGEAEQQANPEAPADPMQGLEDLDLAGPRLG